MTWLLFLFSGLLTAGTVAALLMPVMKAPARADRSLAMGLTLAVPLLALGLYLAFGRPDLADRLWLSSASVAAGEVNAALMAQRPLEKQVAENPADLESVVALAALYHRLGKPEESVAMFERALTLSKGLPLERVIQRLLGQERELIRK